MKSDQFMCQQIRTYPNEPSSDKDSSSQLTRSHDLVEEACPAGLHHSGFSCGNHQPKIFFEIPDVCLAAETSGISKKIFGR